jgi:ribosomal protein S12 methylthiotransferase accessory factor
MHVEVGFPSNVRIQTRCGELVLETGMPPDRGGDPDALGPFDFLLCGLAACTGFHVLTFLDERGCSLEGAGVTIDAERNPDTHLLDAVTIGIRVPKDFPQKYRDAIVRAAGHCAVKAQLGQKPEFNVTVTSA